MRPLSLSERPHPATESLDRLSPKAIDKLLAQCDEEVFDALLDPPFVETLVEAVLDCRKGPATRIVLAGAGTSGRLAWLLARRHRAALEQLGVAVTPWIAGGPRALLLPVEGAEDDFEAARDELSHLLQATDASSLFVGISCGLSAPCVAAGLVAARDLGARRLVFGTNSPELARSEALPGLDRGFRSALESEVYALTPDVGPEPLTGSSRMKGGTATWLVLDAVLALIARGDAQGAAALRDEVSARFEASRELSRLAAARPGRARAVMAAAKALRRGGRVVYVGRGEPGLAALLDASECRPTFGVSSERVRGFVDGAWATLLAGGSVSAQLRDDLTRDCDLDPSLVSRLELDRDDLVVELVAPLDQLDKEHALAVDDPALDASAGSTSATSLGIGEDVPYVRLEAEELLDAKLACNSITTTGFVRAGKVYGNRMLDLMLSNSKLFERACRIVADLAAVDPRRAERSVVAALWLEDDPSQERIAAPIAEHLERARPGVVPLALLHARGTPLHEGSTLLASEPIVREALRQAEG